MADEAQVHELQTEIAALRARLEESEETVRAIRAGEVDAFVVHAQTGDRIYSLRGSEHVYHAFVEQMRDGALTIADDNTILYANRRFQEMLGLPHSRLVGMNLIDHISPEDRYLAEALMQRAQQRESSAELTLAGRDASPVPAHVIGFPVDIDGVVSVCVLVTDMTEVNRYRYDLEQLVVCRTEDLAKQLEEVRSVAQAKSRLDEQLALDLARPIEDIERLLASVPATVGLSSSARVSLGSADVTALENALVRLRSFEQDLTMLAAIAQGTATLEPVPVGLHDVLLEAVGQVQAAAAEKGLEIAADPPAPEVAFIGDAAKVRHVLVTLLLVAVESVPAGHVRVHADVTPELVTKFGVCVPSGVLPFDAIAALLDDARPFELSAQRAVPVTSILTARQVAELMGGRLSIEHGTGVDCFIFALPL